MYPSADEVERSLKGVAAELGDVSVAPFRVGVVPVYGGKPPMYTVVILSAEREPLRQKLGQVVNRSFSLGASSLALKANEVQLILEYGKRLRSGTSASHVRLTRPTPDSA